jgi:hypothetical protein
MSTTRISPEQNKALVLTAFDALFNKQDYQAAARSRSLPSVQFAE